MLRLVDVEKALLGRGYPHRSGELDLHVVDELFPENAGRYRLRVRDGEVELERSASVGAVRIGVGALATLEGMTALFTGPAPASADYF